MWISACIRLFAFALVALLHIAPVAAQDGSWVLVETVELDTSATKRDVTLPESVKRSRALRLQVRRGAVVVTRVSITYGNGQMHFEDRIITLSTGERTKSINPTTVALLPVSLTLAYKVEPGADTVALEIWSLQAPPTPPTPAASAPAPAGTTPPRAFQRRAMDVTSVEPPKLFTEVLVHFATNRRREVDRIKYGRKLATFNGELGDGLSLGEAIVTIPTDRPAGSIPRPVDSVLGIIQWRREDPNRDFTIAAVDITTTDAFAASLARVAGASKTFGGHALVFVHGYNVAFDDSMFRAAQLAHDIGFDGPVAAYSWPSRGAMLDYRHDLDTARVSRTGLQQLLEYMASIPGITRVNLVAHSMGSDPTLEVLARQRAIAKAGGTVKDLKLNEVVFAAPDVTREFFIEQAASIAGIAKGITLYASSNDVALQASKKIAGGLVRAGDVPAEGPAITIGVETIDISKASTSFFALNHSTFAERRQLVEDLRKLLGNERAPRADTFVPTGVVPRLFWRYIGTGG